MRRLACLAFLVLPLATRAEEHRTWAVVVGVSQYDNASVRSLKYADRDARAFAEFLMDPAGGATPRERIFLLTSPEKDPTGQSTLVADRKPTYENIRYALGEFVSKASSDDRMILFIAGHGAGDTAKNLYLLACDTDPAQLRVNGYPMWQMKDVIEKFVPCKEVLLLVDACHGGGAGEGLASVRDVGQDQMEALRQSSSQASGKAVAFLGSSIGSEVSQENESWGGGHGVFTWALLEGLKGAADRDKDGAVSLIELWDYVDEYVKRETKYGQHPDKGNNALFPVKEPLFGARKRGEAPTPPAPAGASDARPVAALKRSSEKAYAASRAVCRVRLAGGEYATGFLVGTSRMLTSYRVAADEKAQAEFGFEKDAEGLYDATKVKRYAVKGVVLAHEAQGWSLIDLEGEPGNEWGVLTLAKEAKVGARVYVVGHLGSEPKGVIGVEQAIHVSRADEASLVLDTGDRGIGGVAPLGRTAWPAGAPLLDDEGQVLGVARGTADAATPAPVVLAKIPAASGPAPAPPTPAAGGGTLRDAGLKYIAKNDEGYEEYEYTLPDGKTKMVLIRVPAGEFQMGSADGEDDEKPVHSVKLDEYLIGKCEVTNAQYRAFVKATGRKHPIQPDDGCGYPDYFGDSKYDDHPVVGVTWDDAKAYCDWAGMKLPTEAQWERAARGKDGRKYPWGNEKLDPGRAQYGKSTQLGDYTKRAASFLKGASAVGALDMAGNVWESCSDWYGAYGDSGDGMSNPTGPVAGSSRVVRGGAWVDVGDSYLRGADRLGSEPYNGYDDVGFRVARSPVR